jgi:hypothetical protein
MEKATNKNHDRGEVEDGDDNVLSSVFTQFYDQVSALKFITAVPKC